MVDFTAKIGHAHLKVRNLDRSVDFYTRFLGLRLTETIQEQFAFLSAGDTHHDIALQALGTYAQSPHPYSVGLYHVAFEVPDRRSFAAAYKNLREAGVPVGAVDHGISWAMYFSDPDGNGLEIYWDTRNQPQGKQAWRGRSQPLSDSQILNVLEQPSS